MRRTITALVVSLGIVALAGEAAAQSTASWDFTGGNPWQQRTGPGLRLFIGGNDCTDDHCDDDWETKFLGSIATTLGFDYRIIPNFAVFAELHLGYVNTDADGVDDDHGMMFLATVGGVLHAPITGWVDAYLGFGMGFAYLGAWAESEISSFWGANDDIHTNLKGINFEFRLGADFYLFSAAPKLALGPQFRLGLVYWPQACVEFGTYDECDDPDDVPLIDENDLPFLVIFGIAGRFGF